jgi:GNAT superfamily N-acetyltransferase
MTADETNEWIVREVQESELDALLDLYTHLHSKDDSLPARDVTEATWQQIMSSDCFRYFAIELDDQLVSSCTITIVPNLTRGCRPYGLIENVVTRDGYRKQGLATRLLEQVLDFAWQQGCYKVMLMTGHKDEETFRFYEGAGFKRGIKTGFIATPPD